MSKNSNVTCTLVFTTPSAVALWVEEIPGQMSDGMWENSGPRDHWKFWYDADCELGTVPGVRNVNGRCVKNAYNLAGLFEYVGDRMLQTGRMAKALHTLGLCIADRGILHASNYMPETLGEYIAIRNKNKDNSVQGASWGEASLEKVPFTLAATYYDTVYTMKDMRADIKEIKSVLKMVPRW